jgi:gamma-glutamyltranspeptidase / glutathione hydrolase
MTRAMICAPQPEAVEAGARALMAGGNAIDAAIACAFVQGVVDPLMCGIAGFGSAQVYMPGGRVHCFIDFHGRVPAAATPDMWAHLIEGETRDGFGFVVKGAINDVGYRSITTPGSLAGYSEAHTRFGRLPWAEVVAPAIAQAANGFQVSPDVYHYWTSIDEPGRVSVLDRLRFSEPSRRLYMHEDGNPKPIGTPVKNPDMANTLSRIAEEGADVFYKGAIASAIAADMRSEWRFALARRSPRVRHDAGSTVARDLSRLRHLHQSPAGRRHHADRDAQHSGELRSDRVRA